MEERNNINKFRQKRAKKKLIWGLAVLLLIVLVVVLIVVNWSKIIEPFKDAALDVGEGGFPVELPGSAGYTLDNLGENFYLLTDTYIYTYNADGAQITNVQHGFQDPVSRANDKRVVVYDKNGKEFKLFSRTGEVYSNSVEDTIVFSDIGNDERCAVVTTSTRYSNYLYVFNGEGKQIFRWASPDYKIMQVEFSDNDKSIYVTALGAKGGDLQLYLFRFDLDNAESHIWQTFIGSSISYSVEFVDGYISVVTGNGCYRINSTDGTLMSSVAVNKSISDIPQADTLLSVVYKDTASNGDVLTVYDSELNQAATLYISGLTRVCEADGKFYVLSGAKIDSYNSALEPLKTYELPDSYSDMIIQSGYAYLLGYNVVERVAL